MATPDSSQKPPKYFADQFDDEEVLYVFRKHPIVMRRGLIIGMSAWLVGPVYTLLLTYLRPENYPSMNFFFGSLLISILLGVLLLMPWWISWYFSVFIVTDQRFIQIQQKGLFNREINDIGLNHIQTMNYKIAGFEETLLGFGTITVQTYMGDVVLHHIHHPAKTHKVLQNILREQGITPKQLENIQPKEHEEA